MSSNPQENLPTPNAGTPYPSSSTDIQYPMGYADGEPVKNLVGLDNISFHSRQSSDDDEVDRLIADAKLTSLTQQQTLHVLYSEFNMSWHSQENLLDTPPKSEDEPPESKHQENLPATHLVPYPSSPTDSRSRIQFPKGYVDGELVNGPDAISFRSRGSNDDDNVDGLLADPKTTSLARRKTFHTLGSEYQRNVRIMSWLDKVEDPEPALKRSTSFPCSINPYDYTLWADYDILESEGSVGSLCTWEREGKGLRRLEGLAMEAPPQEKKKKSLLKKVVKTAKKLF